MRTSILVLLWIAVLPACSVVPLAGKVSGRSDESPAPSRTRISLAGLVGGADARDDTEIRADGTLFGGRLELTREFLESRMIEVGVHTGFGTTDMDVDGPLGARGEVSLDQIVLGPLLRVHFTDAASTFRPFLEGAVGIQQSDVSSAISLPAATSAFGGRDERGLWYRLGGGVSVRGSDSLDWFVSAAYEHSEMDTVISEMDAFVGTFGVRWRF